jgi:hypothetical protein
MRARIRLRNISPRLEIIFERFLGYFFALTIEIGTGFSPADCARRLALRSLELAPIRVSRKVQTIHD